MCADLKWNQEVAASVKRSISLSKDHTNYKFLNFLEMKDKLDHLNLKNNDLKLDSLNLRRNNFSLRHRLDDFKRFLQLIEQNDIPRYINLLEHA